MKDFAESDILSVLSEAKAAANSVATTTISCPFCDGEVFRTAIKCRHCGEFIDGRARPESVITTSTPTSITVEQTSKSWKKIQVQGLVGVAIGFFAFFFGTLLHPFFGALAFFLLSGSLCWWLFGRIGAWWDHG